jgi:hypothetical protein
MVIVIFRYTLWTWLFLDIHYGSAKIVVIWIPTLYRTLVAWFNNNHGQGRYLTIATTIMDI